MVERVQGAIIDKIQRLNQLRANASQYPATLKLIKELVVAFNSYELQRLVSVPSSNLTCSISPLFLFSKNRMLLMEQTTQHTYWCTWSMKMTLSMPSSSISAYLRPFLSKTKLLWKFGLQLWPWARASLAAQLAYWSKVFLLNKLKIHLRTT